MLKTGAQNQAVKTGKAPDDIQGNSAKTLAEHELRNRHFNDHTRQGIVLVKIGWNTLKINRHYSFRQGRKRRNERGREKGSKERREEGRKEGREGKNWPML